MKHLYEYLDFNQLSEEAKIKAIEDVRRQMYEGEYGAYDIPEWVVDDDSLFEPDHQEMANLFGDDYYEANGDSFMLENTRKNISFISKNDPNYYLHCTDAMKITNDNLFLRWLGIPIKYEKYIYYSIDDVGRNSNTAIEFDIDNEVDLINDYGEGVIDKLENYFEKASAKFEKHMDKILTRITKEINSQYDDDDQVIERIDINDIKFDEEGNIAD